MIRHFLDVMSGKVPLAVPLLCTHCRGFRPWLKRHEAAIYKAHLKLLCPCGGTLRKAAG